MAVGRCTRHGAAVACLAIPDGNLDLARRHHLSASADNAPRYGSNCITDTPAAPVSFAEPASTSLPSGWINRSLAASIDAERVHSQQPRTAEGGIGRRIPRAVGFQPQQREDILSARQRKARDDDASIALDGEIRGFVPTACRHVHMDDAPAAKAAVARAAVQEAHDCEVGVGTARGRGAARDHWFAVDLQRHGMPEVEPPATFARAMPPTPKLLSSVPPSRLRSATTSGSATPPLMRVVKPVRTMSSFDEVVSAVEPAITMRAGVDQLAVAGVVVEEHGVPALHIQPFIRTFGRAQQAGTEVHHLQVGQADHHVQLGHSRRLAQALHLFEVCHATDVAPPLPDVADRRYGVGTVGFAVGRGYTLASA